MMSSHQQGRKGDVRTTWEIGEVVSMGFVLLPDPAWIGANVVVVVVVVDRCKRN